VQRISKLKNVTYDSKISKRSEPQVIQLNLSEHITIRKKSPIQLNEKEPISGGNKVTPSTNIENSIAQPCSNA
jgi:hypothetical protein